MKNIFLLAFAGLMLSCGMENQEQKSPETTPFRVMSWNIWHGGHSKEYPNKGCEGTLGILKESNADVILMIETYGASANVADSLGYYHRLLSSNLSIYSRYPITKTLIFPDTIGTFNFGGAELDVKGQTVRVFDTWLHYLPDTRKAPTSEGEAAVLAWDDAGTRDDEMRAILHCLKPYIAEADSIPIIIGGDFNSHSHLDWTEATKDMYNHGGIAVNWTVSSLMQQAGFIDSYRQIHPNPVTHIGTTWMHPIENDTQDRIDYIYYQGNSLQLDTAEVYNKNLGEMLDFRGKQFFYASDHGLVLSTFTLKH